MLGFAAGVATGCVIGVCVSFLVLLLSFVVPAKDRKITKVSLLRVGLATTAVVSLAGACYARHVSETISVVLMLLAVLVVAQMAGAATSLLVTLIAAVTLSILFLPPIGSITIMEPDDRWVMALFLLGATLTSCARFVERQS